LTTFDTLRFTPPSSTQLPNIGNLYLENTTENGISRQTIKSGAPVLISLTRPVFSFDPTKIIQVRDSLPLSDTLYFSRDSIYPRRLSLYGRWQEGKTYKIIIPPGTIQDIYGKTTDSLKFTFNIGKTEEYGNVAVTFSNEDSLMHYVVQIIDDSQRIYYENRIFGKSPEAISLNLLLPGKYMLKVIRDENNNGSWDTGNLSLHRQPEKIVLITLEEIKANWDVETAVNLAEIFKQ
jgi:hypothetical protein